MKSLRKQRTGFVPVRPFTAILGAVAVLAAAPVSTPAAAADTATTAAAAFAAVPQGLGVDDFYKLRQDKPLWFQGGQPTAAVQALLALLSTANVDGLDPGSYKIDEISKALQHAAKGDDRAVRKADELLSEEFAKYARDLRSFPATGFQYVDPALHVGPPTPLRLLELADRAPSLKQFVFDMEWMNPNYAALRKALVSGNYDGDKQRDLLRINLERARVLPADNPRYIIVNTATQRLYMYEGNRLVDSMKVVVGQERPDRKTPTAAGYLHYAFLNPYWNVPPDLVWDDVGVYVEKYGLSYLKSRGYEILSDWSDDATVIDPTTIDWDAVKEGKVQLRVRQLPGQENFLGTVKYTFTNPFGVYLHDTPRKELLDKSIRLYSGGCIRLEDASRLGKWLFGHTLTTTSSDPDIKFTLDKPVPVYVTYMTAVPSGSSITYLDDVYGWDSQKIAQLHSGGDAVAAR